MKGALFLNIVIRKGPSILELFPGKDEALLIGGDSKTTVKTLLGGRRRGNVPLLILDLGLHIIDGVGRLHLEGDSLSSESLYEDLHG